MAAEAAQGPATVTEYIQHHLTNWSWQFGNSPFWTLNLDSLFWSALMGVLFLAAFAIALRTSKRDIDKPPTGFQKYAEGVVEMVDNNVKDNLHSPGPLIAPLAITIFCLILFMNAIDLFPVDWWSTVVAEHGFGLEFFKSVATTDPNITFGMAITVFLLVQYFSFAKKGVGGYAKEFFLHPFNHWALAPVNVLLNFVEQIARPVSLALRLFGNMFAGELVMILIGLFALTSGWPTRTGAIIAWIGQFLAGVVWGSFHVIIVLLQAFIFMMLTIVYLSMAHAHDEH
ncbi:MAG TPA: F0F1 ATP synthase subunit A [Burkholderiales bacterium]|nr:F0F1 ATP synthase subunit A [Burkholderiales bacterium]